MAFPDFDLDALLHYASENYDPVKAHEYYLKNRELKGRHSTKGLTQRQKEGWQYAQAQVRNTTKGKIESARQTKQASIEKARAEAAKFRADFANKLKAFAAELAKQHADNSASIAEQAKQQREAIEKKLADDIAAVPMVPRSLPKLVREKRLKERAEKINALRGQAEADKAELNKNVSSARASEQSDVANARKQANDEAAQTRQQVASQLKSMVASYVEQYKQAKEKATSESEATLDKEYKNIKTRVR